MMIVQKKILNYSIPIIKIFIMIFLEITITIMIKISIFFLSGLCEDCSLLSLNR